MVNSPDLRPRFTGAALRLLLTTLTARQSLGKFKQTDLKLRCYQKYDIYIYIYIKMRIRIFLDINVLINTSRSFHYSLHLFEQLYTLSDWSTQGK